MNILQITRHSDRLFSQSDAPETRHNKKYKILFFIMLWITYFNYRYMKIYITIVATHSPYLIHVTTKSVDVILIMHLMKVYLIVVQFQSCHAETKGNGK